MPLFSILTPCYNSEPWIQRCIDSVILNNESVDYEFIIIDDGSMDMTADICRGYAKKHKQIRFISRENRGYCATMNELLDLARGKYIISLDSDNWLDGSLAKLGRSLAKEDDFDFIQFPVIAVKNGNTAFKFGEISDVKMLCCRKDISQAIEKGEIWIRSHGGKAIMRDTFNGLRFSGDATGSDTRFMQAVTMSAERALLLTYPLLMFEQRESSLSHETKDVGFYRRWIEFYILHLPTYRQTQKRIGKLPELLVVYELYIDGLMTQSCDRAFKRFGRLIWKNRDLFIPPFSKVRSFISRMTACNFPSIYLICVKRHRS